MNKMYKINFTRYIRRQGSVGNLYITIPITEERKNNIEEGDLVEIQLKKVKVKAQSNLETIEETSS